MTAILVLNTLRKRSTKENTVGDTTGSIDAAFDLCCRISFASVSLPKNLNYIMIH
jgi:hypothetical protein